MKARHKAKGGVVYEGAGSNVVKEADERKRGGRVAEKAYDAKGSNVMKEAEEKKRGGRVKEMGKVMGEKAKHRGDKRARGGRIGSDKSPLAPYSSKHPFSSAAKG